MGIRGRSRQRRGRTGGGSGPKRACGLPLQLSVFGLLRIPQLGLGHSIRSSPRSRDSRGAQREEGTRQSGVSSLQVSPSEEDEVAWEL